jgi:NCAIR mutase (PurE)-related protein
MDFQLDWLRETRTGVAEAVLSCGKSVEQIEAMARLALSEERRLFFTRLTPEVHARLAPNVSAGMEYDRVSHTAIVGEALPLSAPAVCIVCAGSSDMRVVGEAQRTLNFAGIGASVVPDVGVAGLWRLLERIEFIRQHDVVIAVAGMEGALFSVLAGLLDRLVIAVPTSVGYGVSSGGEAALSSALASCAPGLVVVNIDNGFGAAGAAMKLVRSMRTGKQAV